MIHIIYNVIYIYIYHSMDDSITQFGVQIKKKKFKRSQLGSYILIESFVGWAVNVGNFHLYLFCSILELQMRKE